MLLIQAKGPSGLITSLLRERPPPRKRRTLVRLSEGLWVVFQFWYCWCYYSTSTVGDAFQKISQSTHVRHYTTINHIFLIPSPVPAHSDHVLPNTKEHTMSSTDQPSITPISPNSKRGPNGFMATPASPPPVEEAAGSGSLHVTPSPPLSPEEPLQHSDSGLRDVDPVSILPSGRTELPPVYSSLWFNWSLLTIYYSRWRNDTKTDSIFRQRNSFSASARAPLSIGIYTFSLGRQWVRKINTIGMWAQALSITL